MKEIGQILKEAREAKGLSISKLSEITRIRPSYLTAIEDGDFTRVPGAVYIKGFLKSFAVAVGVNPTEILDMFSKYQQQHPEVEPEVQEIKLVRTKAPINIGKFIVIGLVVGAVVVSGVFVVRFWSILKNETIPQLREPEITEDVTPAENGTVNPDGQGAEGVNTTPADSNTPATGTPITTEPVNTTPSATQATQVHEPAATPAQQPTNTTQEPATSAEETAPAMAAQQTNLTRVKIIANGDSWIRVQVDSQVVFTDMIKEGQTQVYEGQTIHLRIGNASVIQVDHDGNIVGPFGKEGQVVERVFENKGV